MKTIHISALILIVLPVHLFAQESGQDRTYAPNYFSKHYFEAGGSANHVTNSTTTSNRKGAVQLTPSISESLTPTVAIAQPEVSETAFGGGDFSAVKVQPLFSDSVSKVNPPAERVALTPFTPIEPPKFTPFKVSTPQEVQEIEVDPTFAADDLASPSDIVRPTPENTEPATAVRQPSSASPEPIREEYTVEPPIQSQKPAVAEGMSDEPVSLDRWRTTQDRNSWNEKPNTMRHVTDHFSPGGQPFARQTNFGDSNFFGVDRRSCCDEWAGFCRCSGGLKGNPGHLGIPWLRSKEPCDSATAGPCRAKRAGGNACGCTQSPQTAAGCSQCGQ